MQSTKYVFMTSRTVAITIGLSIALFAFVPAFSMGGAHFTGSVAYAEDGCGDGPGDAGSGSGAGSSGDAGPGDSGSGGGGGDSTPWTPTTPSTTAPRCTITASAAVISFGGYSILSWSSSDATSASITGLGSVTLAGGLSVYPTATTSYTMTVSGAGGTASCSTVVTVREATPAPTCSLDVGTTSLQQGSSTSLTWNTSNATLVTLSQFGSVTSSGSQTISPQNTTTYTLTAHGANGVVTCEKTVGVYPREEVQPYCSMYASQANVPYNGSTTLYWNSSNGTSAHIDAIGSVSTNGSYTVTGITGTRTFNMTVYGSNGSTQRCSVSVYTQQVPPPPQYNEPYCTITAQNSGYNGQTSLTWNSSNAYSAYITNIGTVASSGQTTVYSNGTYTMTVYGYNGQSRTCSTTVYNHPTYTPPTYYPPTYNPPVQYTYVPPTPTYTYVPPTRVYVPLRQIPYTGAEDVVGSIFALASAVTTAYGALRFRFA